MIVTIISFAIVQYILIAGYRFETRDLLFPYSRTPESNTYNIGTIVLLVMGLFGNDVVFLTALNLLLGLSLIKILMMWKNLWRRSYKKYDAAISIILLLIMNLYAVSVLLVEVTK